jgi:hypothetical protein
MKDGGDERALREAAKLTSAVGKEMENADKGNEDTQARHGVADQSTKRPAR